MTNIQKDTQKTKMDTPVVPRKILDSPETDTILNHWNKISAIKEIYDSSSFKLISQGIRSDIVDLFREGIKEYNPISEQALTRHVFSAKEILEHMEKTLEAGLTLQNIYFHLSKLEKAGFIIRIAYIKEGRNITKYYGRTARLFVQVGSSNEFFKEDKMKKIQTLIKKINPDITTDTQINVTKELKKSTDESRQRIKHWIEVNEKILLELNYDFRDIYEILFLIDTFDRSTNEITLKLAKLLKYP